MSGHKFATFIWFFRFRPIRLWSIYNQQLSNHFMLSYCNRQSYSWSPNRIITINFVTVQRISGIVYSLFVSNRPILCQHVCVPIKCSPPQKKKYNRTFIINIFQIFELIWICLRITKLWLIISISAKIPSDLVQSTRINVACLERVCSNNGALRSTPLSKPPSAVVSKGCVNWTSRSQRTQALSRRGGGGGRGLSQKGALNATRLYPPFRDKPKKK